MIHLRISFAAGLLFAAAACTSSVGSLPPLASPAASDYRIGPGDELRIAVYGFDQMANVYSVSDAGTISLPLLSTIDAAGQSPSELEASIARVLRERDLAPTANVSVQIQKYRPFYILGEVQRPGQYAYVPGMTLKMAVAIAGGYTFRAHTKSAAVTRMNGDAATAKGKADPDSPILPGDTIEVPEAWF